MNASLIARMAGTSTTPVKHYLKGESIHLRNRVKIEKALAEYYQTQIDFNMNEIDRIAKNNNEMAWKIAKLNLEVR